MLSGLPPFQCKKTLAVVFLGVLPGALVDGEVLLSTGGRKRM